MLSEQQLQAIARRIAEAMDPERIILFGSYADGTAQEDSDVDLLIVVQTSLRPPERQIVVQRLLDDIPAAFDLIVKTPEEFHRGRRALNTITYFAAKYGRVIYERRDQSGRTAMAG